MLRGELQEVSRRRLEDLFDTFGATCAMRDVEVCMSFCVTTSIQIRRSLQGFGHRTLRYVLKESAHFSQGSIARLRP